MQSDVILTEGIDQFKILVRKHIIFLITQQNLVISLPVHVDPVLVSW